MSDDSVAIVGGGAWGTALAAVLGRRDVSVALWMREADLVARMRDRRDNPVYLPGIEMPRSVRPTEDLAVAVRDAGLVVFAVPTSFARAVYEDLRGSVPPASPVVVATKGIEEGTLLLPTEVARACLGGERPVAALSGPSFAEEVARGVPTAVAVASDDADVARRVQDRLAGDTLRLYTNEDLVGVQVAGALKNVVAIAAGIVDGLNYGHNTIAALVTRGLAEMSRLGVALGASPETFSGLAGLGDLVLTCTGSLSRNRPVGQSLGRGERIQDVLPRMAHVAEGVRTTLSARDLARRAGVAMPIVDEVYGILYEDRSPGEAVRRLMTRPLTSERGPEGESRA